MKILVGVDFSRASDAAVQEVGDRPWPPGTLVRLVAVVEPLDFAASGVFVEGYVKSETDRAQERILNLAEALRRRGLTVSTILAPGLPRTELAAQAKEWKADLVVVGSRGRGVLKRALLGSVAQAAVRRSPCSVEIVRPRRKTSKQSAFSILLATDGSEPSLDAARSVARRPWPEGTRVRVVCVGRNVPVLEEGWAISTAAGRRLQDSIHEGTARTASATAALLQGSGLSVSEETHIGDAREQLIEQCWAGDADLLVVGTHGRHGLDRMLGSVSEHVAIHAPCSVEVIRAV